MNLGKIAAEQPGRPAVIMAGSRQAVTFAALDAAANRLAHVLFDSGLRPVDHIAFMRDNRWESLAVAWAAPRSGLYYTPVSSRLRADEIKHIVGDCGARAFITSKTMAGGGACMAAVTPNIQLRLMLDVVTAGFTSYEEMTATPLPHEVEGSDRLYSSGTTGRPKGVERPLSPVDTPDSLYQLISGLLAHYKCPDRSTSARSCHASRPASCSSECSATSTPARSHNEQEVSR